MNVNNTPFPYDVFYMQFGEKESKKEIKEEEKKENIISTQWPSIPFGD